MGAPADWRAIDCSLVRSNKWIAASDTARVLWIQLLLRCDNRGTFEADVDIIWAASTKQFGWSRDRTAAALRRLVDVDLVHVWKVDGFPWGHIVDFDDHQHGEFLRKRGKPRNPLHDCAGDTPDESPPYTNTNTVSNDTHTNTDTPSVGEVFEYWAAAEAATGGIQSPKLTDGRVKRIRARLAEGYTVEQLRTAIDGFLHDDWHLGKNDRHTRFTDIPTILKNGPKVDAGILKAGSGNGRGKYDYLNGSSDDR